MMISALNTAAGFGLALWRCPVLTSALLACLGTPGLVGVARCADHSLSKLKLPLSGLVAMGDIGFHRQDGGLAHSTLGDLIRFRGLLGGMVVNITWEQLEPRRGILQTREIDRVLDEIRAYNQANPEQPIGARLRVWPGPNAPAWVKSLGGGPVTVLHKQMPITVGRFWTKPCREAWRNLQARLAVCYDAEPLIREVSNTSGSSITDEAMLLPGDAFSISNLLAAGFTDKQYQDCLMDSTVDYAGWANTPVEWACNPYRAINSGKPRADRELTVMLMRHWRQTLGHRGILGNHALSNPIAAHLLFIYDELRRLGPPIALQTQSPKGLDWEGALRLGLSCKAGSIELWSGTRFGGFETKSPETLRQWKSWFPP